MEGPDAKDLLQRITTNDLNKLDADYCVQTVFTNEKGRIVDVVTVVELESVSYLLVAQTREPEKLRAWIERFIIMEDARVVSLTESYRHLLFYDPKTVESLTADLGGSTVGRNVQLKILGSGEKEPFLLVMENWNGARILHALQEKSDLKKSVENGSLSISKEGESREFKSYRILYTIPVNPNELNESYNPLEANLWSYVSWTKGCYVGQEVIARLDTYKKVQRMLCTLEISGQVFEAPLGISNGREDVGMITSSIQNGSSTMALGYVSIKSLDMKESLFCEVDGAKFEIRVVASGVTK
jgi:folate-binding protein YgfZ